jgi:hypothetical protein
VPLTPPATWTPNVPAPTSTIAPTPAPTEDRSTSASPYPVLELQADQETLAPGQAVSVSLVLANEGGVPLSGAVLTLSQPDLLRLTRSRTTSGETQPGQGQLVWRPESLAAGGKTTLDLEMTLSEDALPDRELLLTATLIWPGGEPLTANTAFILPWAMLPATGL